MRENGAADKFAAEGMATAKGAWCPQGRDKLPKYCWDGRSGGKRPAFSSAIILESVDLSTAVTLSRKRWAVETASDSPPVGNAREYNVQFGQWMTMAGKMLSIFFCTVHIPWPRCSAQYRDRYHNSFVQNRNCIWSAASNTRLWLSQIVLPLTHRGRTESVGQDREENLLRFANQKLRLDRRIPCRTQSPVA